jgi:hypothetical protein
VSYVKNRVYLEIADLSNSTDSSLDFTEWRFWKVLDYDALWKRSSAFCLGFRTAVETATGISIVIGVHNHIPFHPHAASLARGEKIGAFPDGSWFTPARFGDNEGLMKESMHPS